MKNYAMIEGRITSVSDTRKIAFPNGECPVVTISVDSNGTLIPIDVWSDKKVDWVKNHMNENATYLCTITGNSSTYTAKDGQQKTICKAILRLNKMLMDSYDANKYEQEVSF